MSDAMGSAQGNELEQTLAVWCSRLGAIWKQPNHKTGRALNSASRPVTAFTNLPPSQCKHLVLGPVDASSSLPL